MITYFYKKYFEVSKYFCIWEYENAKQIMASPSLWNKVHYILLKITYAAWINL